MMEDTLCAESKWQCIPGAKEEFLRYSLTQHFRAKHHLEKSYFLLGLLFVVKCFCSSVSGGGCVRLQASHCFVSKAKFYRKRLSYCHASVCIKLQMKSKLDHFMLLVSPAAHGVFQHSLNRDASQNVSQVCLWSSTKNSSKKKKFISPQIIAR